MSETTDQKNTTSTVTPPPKSVEKKPESTSAGVYVLQWLTYTFWGWLSAALVWLVWVIAVYLIDSHISSTAIPYAIAAGVIMTPLAFVTDFFYSKHEPLTKRGAAIIITVIHSIGFALIAIGTLIAALFLGVNTLVEVSDVNHATSITTLLVTCALSSLAFLRALNPFKNRRFITGYRYAMLGCSLIALAVAAISPTAQLVATKQDRRIEQNLYQVQNSINEYINEHTKHPASLDDISLSQAGEDLKNDDRISFVAGDVTRNSRQFSGDTYRYRFNYQLCAVYDHANKKDRYESEYRDYDDGYESILRTSGHPAGKTCYKLYTTVDVDTPLILDSDSAANDSETQTSESSSTSQLHIRQLDI